MAVRIPRRVITIAVVAVVGLAVILLTFHLSRPGNSKLAAWRRALLAAGGGASMLRTCTHARDANATSLARIMADPRIDPTSPLRLSGYNERMPSIKAALGKYQACQLPEGQIHLSALLELKGPEFEPIPHILHQSWKNNDIPENFARWAATWRKNHPNWEYKYWTGGCGVGCVWCVLGGHIINSELNPSPTPHAIALRNGPHAPKPPAHHHRR